MKPRAAVATRGRVRGDMVVRVEVVSVYVEKLGGENDGQYNKDRKEGRK